MNSDTKFFNELISIIKNVVTNPQNWYTFFESFQSNMNIKDIQYFKDPFYIL